MVSKIGMAAIGLAVLTAPLAHAQDAPPPTPVTVETLRATDVVVTATLPGRIVASGTAEVRPQVAGIIVERLFEEGEAVELDDPLYRIDPASYAATLEAAEAQVAQAEATLRGLEREVERTDELVERRVVSQQTLDDIHAERDAAAAALKVAKARRLSARIDLERTTIRAPLAGIIGRSLVTQGALVTAGQADPLAVIRALDPVLVDVTQSAAEVVAWKRKHASERLGQAETEVTLTLADGEAYDHTGELKAAEPHVNETTGVVTLRMTFPNPDGLLLPGMYAQVEMPQGLLEDVILAPQQGVSRDRRGEPVALVVNADNVVEQRMLTVAGTRGNAWIVTEGLDDGDRIIVEGLQKVAPGATVAPEERESGEESEPAKRTGARGDGGRAASGSIASR